MEKGIRNTRGDPPLKVHFEQKCEKLVADWVKKKGGKNKKRMWKNGHRGKEKAKSWKYAV